MPRKQLQRPPTIRTFVTKPTGQRQYQYSTRSFGQVKGGPGAPPPGFLTATNSVTEWMVYWAFARIYANPKDPRIGPFHGGPPQWTYQQPVLGGRFTPLGAVTDFIDWRPYSGRPVIVRVQTEHWHLFASTEKQIEDLMQKARLGDRADVVDIYDYQFTDDPTGQSVIQVVKSAVGLIETPDPLRAGVVQRNVRTGQ
jgi:hypothetical protein